jgi:putative phage-type endonuclease
MDLVQQSPEWHEFRKKHIGNSDIAAIVGLSPWKTQHELWLEKTGRKGPEIANYAMERGLSLESDARRSYEELTGLAVIPQVVTYPEFDFCSASLDGQTFDRETIVEIKCPMSDKTWLLAKEQKIEPHYECQVQWQLLISGAKHAHFFVYMPTLGNVLLELKPEPKKQKVLLDAAKAFWQFVIDDVEPEKPEDNFILVDTPEYIMAAEKWKLANRELKTAQEIEKQARAALLDETDGGNVFGCGIQIKRIDPEDCVDWKAVKLAFELTEEKLKPFLKKKASYFRITSSERDL